MNSETIEVSVKHVIVLKDADGVAIHEGSVLRHVSEECRGVLQATAEENIAALAKMKGIKL